jgi:hypothetical protein
MLRTALLLPYLLLGAQLTAQLNDDHGTFTPADSLRGSIGPERAWWDVRHYAVFVTPDLDQRTIKGRTYIKFTATKPGRRMQIDLQQPLEVDSIHMWVERPFQVGDGRFEGGTSVKTAVPFEREGDVIWLDLPVGSRIGGSPGQYDPGEGSTLWIDYHGKPKAAKNPPWDGGWIWRKDAQGNPWVSVACQGLGASVWYPCKDHQSDEPEEGATLHIIVPDSLQGIGNGRLRGTSSNGDGTTTWEWQVSDPINTYNLIPYIGKYTHWSEVYQGKDGPLPCDYWVLAGNEAKARDQFKQVPEMLRCFEEWLGPYPFYRDGYKLVESPHLGMEHQSAIAYGNNYVNGYRGHRLERNRTRAWSGTTSSSTRAATSGSATASPRPTSRTCGSTRASPTTARPSSPSASKGPDAAQDYVIGLRDNIRNDKPIIGHLRRERRRAAADMYYKGANLIHMIRHIVGDSTFKDHAAGHEPHAITTRWSPVPRWKPSSSVYMQRSRERLHPTPLRPVPARHARCPVLEHAVKNRPTVDALDERGAWPRTPGQDAYRRWNDPHRVGHHVAIFQRGRTIQE